MSWVRILIVAASVVQVAAGFFVGAYWGGAGRPDPMGLTLCAIVIVVGLASLTDGLGLPGRAASRRATIALNGVVLALFGATGLIMLAVDHHLAITGSRAFELLRVGGLATLPSLVSAAGLLALDHPFRCAKSAMN